MANRIPLIAGNWKMNLDHQQAIALVQKLSWTLKDADFDYKSAEVVVFPPFTDLRTVQTLIDAEKLELGFGAQDLEYFVVGQPAAQRKTCFVQGIQTDRLAWDQLHSGQTLQHGRIVCGGRVGHHQAHQTLVKICRGHVAHLHDRWHRGHRAALPCIWRA